VFDINQLICIHNLLGVESETLFKKERGKERDELWLIKEQIRSDDVSGALVVVEFVTGRLFFLKFYFLPFVRNFPTAVNNFFFSFYYRRNS
jgi:hypothetical protein